LAAPEPAATQRRLTTSSGQLKLWRQHTSNKLWPFAGEPVVMTGVQSYPPNHKVSGPKVSTVQ
jgi:hypothetical protein